MSRLLAVKDGFGQIGSQESEWDDAADVPLIKAGFLRNGALANYLAPEDTKFSRQRRSN